MPTYDFRCEACGHTFEEMQSFSAKPLKKCPACGKLKLRRLIGTGAAVLFKGSGFYQTDYRSESYQNAAKADQEASKPATPAATDAKGTGGTAGSAGSKTDKGKTPKSSE